MDLLRRDQDDSGGRSSHRAVAVGGEMQIIGETDFIESHCRVTDTSTQLCYES